MSGRRVLWVVIASLDLVIAVQAGVPDSPSAGPVAGAGPSPAFPSLQPIAPVRPVSEEYFGTKVTDPYRYMEELRDPQVQTWFKAQDDYTRAVLATIPGRAQLLDRIKQLAESAPYQVSDVQRFKSNKFYYQKRSATEEVGKLYQREGLNGNERLLVDPAKFISVPRTHYSLNYYAPSYDGRYVAYGMSPSGSEDAVIHVLDLVSGRETGETIDRSWYGGISWLPDNRSFFHIRFQKLAAGADPTERRLKSRVWLHQVGTDAESDVAVFGYGVNPEISLEPADTAFVVTDARTTCAFAGVNRGFQNELSLFAAPLESVGKSGAHWRKLCDPADAVTGFDWRGDDLFLVTHKNAPRFKVIRISISHPDLAAAKVVVAPGEAVINSITAAPDSLYAQELDAGIGKLLRVRYTGAPGLVSLPVEGNLELMAGDPTLSGLLLGSLPGSRPTASFSTTPRRNRLQTPG